MDVLVRLMVNLYVTWAAQNAYSLCQSCFAPERRLNSLAKPYEYPQGPECSSLCQRHAPRLHRCQRGDYEGGGLRIISLTQPKRTDATADGEPDREDLESRSTRSVYIVAGS